MGLDAPDRRDGLVQLGIGEGADVGLVALGRRRFELEGERHDALVVGQCVDHRLDGGDDGWIRLREGSASRRLRRRLEPGRVLLVLRLEQRGGIGDRLGLHQPGGYCGLVGRHGELLDRRRRAQDRDVAAPPKAAPCSLWWPAKSGGGIEHRLGRDVAALGGGHVGGDGGQLRRLGKAATPASPDWAPATPISRPTGNSTLPRATAAPPRPAAARASAGRPAAMPSRWVSSTSRTRRASSGRVSPGPRPSRS